MKSHDARNRPQRCPHCKGTGLLDERVQTRQHERRIYWFAYPEDSSEELGPYGSYHSAKLALDAHCRQYCLDEYRGKETGNAG